jgi:UDP-glucose 4-epimerase
MRVLVTGGAGFIASHVVDAYLAAGHEVAVVDDLSGGRRENLNPRARFYQLDVRAAEIDDVLARERPEVLNLHAAQMSVRRSVDDPAFDAQVNVLGLLNLLERGRRHGVRRVLFASSGGAIYGDQETYPAPEQHPTAPLSPYGITKLAGERYLYFYAVEYRIPYVALRYGNVYGPRQDPHGEAGVIAIFSEKLLTGQQPVINGDGAQTRDYVYIEDVVRANVAVLDRDYSGPLNIGTGRETSVNELFRALQAACGTSLPEQHGPAKSGEQRRSVIDPARAAEVLGWRAQTSLADGLRRTLDFFRQKLARS